MGLAKIATFIQEKSDRLPWDYIDLIMGVLDELGAFYLLATISVEGYHDKASILICILLMYTFVALGIWLDLVELSWSCTARSYLQKYDHEIVAFSAFH